MAASLGRRYHFDTFSIYKSTDGASSWAPISADLTIGTGYLTAITVAPNSSDTVFVGSADGKAHVTVRGAAGAGTQWLDRSTGLPNRCVTKIAVAPDTSSTAYLIGSLQVCQTVMRRLLSFCQDRSQGGMVARYQ